MNAEAGQGTLCFIDANIWLYAFITSQDSQKSLTARELIRTQTGYVTVSTQVINEVSVNLIKKAHFDESLIRQLIEAFFQSCQVVIPTIAIQITASEWRERHSFSFWDSLIIAAALHSGATLLYSEDLQDGFVLEGRLTIANPFRETSKE